MTVHRKKIGLIGVGGAGCHIVAQLLEQSTIPDTTLLIDRDEQSLAQYTESMRLLIVQDALPKPLCSAPPQWSRQALLNSAENIANRVSGLDAVVIVAGLGGSTSTGAVPAVASLCKDRSLYTAAVVSSPFKFEGKKRVQQAQVVLDELNQSTDKTFHIPNNGLLELVPGTTMMGECYRLLDTMLVLWVKDCLERITHQ